MNFFVFPDNEGGFSIKNEFGQKFRNYNTQYEAYQGLKQMNARRAAEVKGGGETAPTNIINEPIVPSGNISAPVSPRIHLDMGGTKNAPRNL